MYTLGDLKQMKLIREEKTPIWRGLKRYQSEEVANILFTHVPISSTTYCLVKAHHKIKIN